jgi:alpha-amylase
MNWDDIDLEVFEHFKKLGTFRARNLAVGAGVHTEISQDPFIFKRDYNKGNESNTVLIAMNQSKETSLDVSMAFSDGDLLRDAYTMTAYKVEAGKIRLEPHESGLVLLERLIP